MEKKPFQAESKRLMDLMIHSIYTHKEIFLREIISNASDAVDKLAYLALTDEKVGLNRDDFSIVVKADKEARTLTVSDNGIGMDQAAMEQNLGTIAKSGSLQFKEEMEKRDDAEIDIIGQFGVGFYSAFMVADKVTVISRPYGSQEAYKWESAGVEGYTIEPCTRSEVGTDVIMTLKADADDEDYGKYLNETTLSGLVKKYSDYIRYPIRMELEKTRQKERPADAPEDYKPEYETLREWETVNSMIPLWQRAKSQVTEEEYQSFYREKFFDWEAPLVTAHVAVEGNLEYKAILYVPAKVPMDYYNTNYQRGLQLYSSGVMIMEACEALLPEHFGFVRGIVDSPDVSLNISREMLQHDRQLKVIANNLEKKIKAELLKLQKDQREKYETFWSAFGLQIKYALLNGYGKNKELLSDLLLFWSSKEKKLVTLAEYKERMPESQQFVYFAVADTVEKAAALPQAERILEAGYEVLYLISEEEELVLQSLADLEGKEFLSVAEERALPMTDLEKTQAEEAEKSNQELLDFLKERLNGQVAAVRISKILKSGACCLTAEGPISIEMAQYFKKINAGFPMETGKVLELNPNAPAFEALCKAFAEDQDKAAKYGEILYCQALLIANLPLPDPVRYTRLVTELMA